ncbi:hypothetical protein Q4485_13435 [Granulosicoccaceae sp. 1_MG-2023]|nr:hypothetical protein [Granulosicoccaceae sp. 1_MG-2023]
MADKSGGDIYQGNTGMQGNMSAQSLNSIAGAGAGAVDAFGGMADAMGMATQNVVQNQTQGNIAASGAGGSDNVQADTTINA